MDTNNQIKDLISLEIRGYRPLPLILPYYLVKLYCRGCNLVTLPLLPPTLRVLNCDLNKLDALPWLPMTITKLFCSGNRLTKLPMLPFRLKKLYCSSNLLMTLPALPKSLRILWCHYNKLTRLPKIHMGLEVLYCGDNNINIFPELPTSVITINLGNNIYSLDDLMDIDFTKIESFLTLFDIAAMYVDNINIWEIQERLDAREVCLGCGRMSILVYRILPTVILYRRFILIKYERCHYCIRRIDTDDDGYVFTFRNTNWHK